MTLDAKVGRRRDKKCNYLKKILHSSCHFRAVIFGKVQKLLILIFEANCEFPKLDFILFLSQRCDHDRRNKSEKFFAERNHQNNVLSEQSPNISTFEG